MPITSANRVVSQAVSWLWPGRIPLGKLVILDGNPDLGKSLLALDWCARLSSGRPFPDSETSLEPANSLVLSAEDAPHDTIVPRLEGLGADMSRVFVWQRAGDDDDWPWRFPSHLDRLDDALAQTGARLAVIDPVMAFLDASVLSASDQSVRRALAPLIQMAENHQCTMLLHRHLNKQGGRHALFRGMGSIAFVAACRFAMLVERDPNDSSRCVLAPVRHSLAKLPASLIYQIAATDGRSPTVTWLGRSPFSANHLLAFAGKGCQPRDQAADFLESFLAAGPQHWRDIYAAARKAGLSKRTLQRAKRELGVRNRRVYLKGLPVSYWLLPHQELGPEHYDAYEIERMIREFQQPLNCASSEEGKAEVRSSESE